MRQTRVRSCLAGERGQALVELVACVPVIALVVLAIAQGMLALGAGGSAERALERGRIAAALGLDPVAAARRGLTKKARVELEGGTLRVSVPLPRLVAGIPLPAVRASASVG